MTVLITSGQLRYYLWLREKKKIIAICQHGPKMTRISCVNCQTTHTLDCPVDDDQTLSYNKLLLAQFTRTLTFFPTSSRLSLRLLPFSLSTSTVPVQNERAEQIICPVPVPVPTSVPRNHSTKPRRTHIHLLLTLVKIFPLISRSLPLLYTSNILCHPFHP